MLKTSIVALLFFASATTVFGQERKLDEAVTAYQSGELFRALELFTEALETRGNSPQDLVTIHTHLGILKGSLADLDGARSAFETALTIDASLEAPSELNPELRAVFDEVATARGGQPIALDVEPVGPVRAGSDIRLGVRIAFAPEGLVSAVRAEATVPSGGAPVTAEVASTGDGDGSVTIPAMVWRGGERVEVAITVLDRWGGLLATASIEVTAPVHVSDATVSVLEGHTEVDDGGGVFASPWFWIITAIVVLGGAAAVTAVLLTSETQALVGPPNVMALLGE